jgi:DNA repair protein RecO (recombination protein O)
MTSHISSAIMMRIREFGETDLLVSFFTPDRGRLKGIAKGGRRSRKRFANCLDLFCLASLEYELKKKGDLHFLHSCKLIDAFPGIRSDFSSLSLASYMVELTEILFPVGVADRVMFELLENTLRELNERKGIEDLRIRFEARAMALGGYGINFEHCCVCGRPYTGQGRAVFKRSKGGIACLRCEKETETHPGLSHDTVEVLRILQSGECINAEPLLLTKEMVHEIKPVFKLHMEYRIGRRLKSAAYLE